MELTSDALFVLMCNSDVCIMNYQTSLISVPTIASHFKVSKYRVRLLMKELQEKGLVKSGIDSFYDNYCEQQILIRGFGITKAAHETEIYKRAYNNEMKLIEECFGHEPKKDVTA
jgi:hypothetical protein